jgi:hypothetical protein
LTMHQVVEVQPGAGAASAGAPAQGSDGGDGPGEYW